MLHCALIREWALIMGFQGKALLGGSWVDISGLISRVTIAITLY